MNKKWYINEFGIKVKPCANCGESFPCTKEYYPIKESGTCYAYCWNCKRKLDREYSNQHNKTNKKHIKRPVTISNGVPYKKCNSCGVEYPFTSEFYDSQHGGQHNLKSSCKKCRRDYSRNSNKENWAYHLYRNALGSSRRYGLELNISPKYILDLFEQQEHKCYWLRITLVPSSEPKSLSQPSLDRINRELGYIKGNVVLCSFFANFGRNENSEFKWKLFLLDIEKKFNFELWNKK